MKGFGADPEEGEAFLARNLDIAFIDTVFTSLNGVPRGKRLRRSELAKVYSGGCFSPASIAGVDIRGTDVPGNGLLWELGDADALMVPVPGGISRAPWLGHDVAQVVCSLHDLDGRPNPLDPRAVLARVLARLQADGFTPVVACELEFYLLDHRREPDGSARLRPSPVTGQSPQGAETLGLAEIDDADDFLRALWSAADEQELPVEGASSEASPGQLELTLRHRPDALRAGDDAAAFKRIAKGVARQLGSQATFMAKPFANSAGSGMHIHMSMLGADERNIFEADTPDGTVELRYAIGGMAATMAESFALLAPNANSYRRYVARSHAPTAPTWGVNNRTVALRIPAGTPASRRVEHRVAGADANPYLALAVVLAGAHHGLKQALDPGAPVRGDGYAARPTGDALPSNWAAALDRLDGSAVIRDYLGDAFVNLFLSVKWDEYGRFQAEVPTLDHEWYLANA